MAIVVVDWALRFLLARTRAYEADPESVQLMSHAKQINYYSSNILLR